MLGAKVNADRERRANVHGREVELKSDQKNTASKQVENQTRKHRKTIRVGDRDKLGIELR